MRLFGPTSRPNQPSGIPSSRVALPTCAKVSVGVVIQQVSDLGVLVKLVSGDIIDGEHKLDIVGLCLFDESDDLF